MRQRCYCSFGVRRSTFDVPQGTTQTASVNLAGKHGASGNYSVANAERRTPNAEQLVVS